MTFNFTFQFKVIRFNQISYVIKYLFTFTLKQTFAAAVRSFLLFV